MGFFDRFRKKPEVSPGGSAIYRYGTQEDTGLRIPENIGIYSKELERHFEGLFPGRECRVFHETVSDLVHIDITVMWPTQEQQFFVLYTTGMSDLPMSLPEDIPANDQEKLAWAELYLFLPCSWMIDKEPSNFPEHVYWPIRMMKFLARFPHLYHTWLGVGHTMPNGPDYAPLGEGVGFGGVVFTSGGDEALSHLTAADGRRINLLCLIPAYKEEIEYKLKYGMEGLDKVFQDKELNLILDPHRPNYCADFNEVLDG